MRVVFVILLVLAAAGGAYWYGSRPPPAPLTGDVVARVGDRVITVQDFVDEMAARGGHLPGQYQRTEQRRALLDAMIEQELLVAAAVKAGLDQDREVKAAIRRILVNRYREQLMDEELAKITVSDEEIAAFYQANQVDFTRPERRRAALLFAKAGGHASEELRDDAQRRLEEAQRRVAELDPNILHFGALAQEYSDDTSTRYLGGVIGWLSAVRRDRYKWPAPVIEAVFALEQAGQMSTVIEADSGYYLVRLVALEGGSAQPLDDVAMAIKRRLMKEKADDVRANLFDQIKRQIEFELNDAVLATIEPLSPPAGARTPPAVPGTDDDV